MKVVQILNQNISRLLMNLTEGDSHHNVPWLHIIGPEPVWGGWHGEQRTVTGMDSWKFSTKRDRSNVLTSPASTLSATPPTSLSQRNKQYLKVSIEGVDWLTNYQMSVVIFKIFICEIIEAFPPLNG